MYTRTHANDCYREVFQSPGSKSGGRGRCPTARSPPPARLLWGQPHIYAECRVSGAATAPTTLMQVSAHIVHFKTNGTT